VSWSVLIFIDEPIVSEYLTNLLPIKQGYVWILTINATLSSCRVTFSRAKKKNALCRGKQRAYRSEIVDDLIIVVSRSILSLWLADTLLLL